VPCWGANTVRNGIRRSHGYIGYGESASTNSIPISIRPCPRFSPWYGNCGAQGYRTVCVHPFDRRFYGRDKVMSNLGFDEFLGEEGFAGAHRHWSLCRRCGGGAIRGRMLAQQGEPVRASPSRWENHGPWPTGTAGRSGTGTAAWRWHDLALPPKNNARSPVFFRGFRNADASWASCRSRSPKHAPGALLAMYGDHLRAPRKRSAHGFRRSAQHTCFGAPGNFGAGMRKDSAAQHLMGDILAGQPARLGAVTHIEKRARSSAACASPPAHFHGVRRVGHNACTPFFEVVTRERVNG